MNYEVMTHFNRDLFQEYLKQLPGHKTLHSFQYSAPHIIAVYQWLSQAPTPQQSSLDIAALSIQ